ncbi:MAG TPA: DUF72 domain-containing protein [Calidithermus sp.]|nr:DUF72 domain-containing protein [Calidithermus sp.]
MPRMEIRAGDGGAVRVGTSGFAYPEWKGSFYPADLPVARMLAYYAERFDTVEINATFYRMPTAKTLAGWAALTPERFVFALKAPQRITHVARLRGVEEPVRAFLQAARTLGPRLGPVLFQLPPTLPRDLDRLGALLLLLPPDLRAAVEFRHPSWFADPVYERLRAAGVALCVADTEAGTTPLEATAPFGYLRLRDLDYTDTDLARWARTVRGTWTEAWVYFKHEASGRGPALAARLRAHLEG